MVDKEFIAVSETSANYQIKPGFKQTEVGLIPEGWQVRRLGDIGSFNKGKGIRKDEVLSDGVPCVRYGELYTRHHEHIKNISSFISSETAKESKRINNGDILFAGSGETKEEIGKCAAYLSDKEAYAGGDVIVFSPKSVSSLLLGYILNFSLVTKQKAQLAQGDAVVHIYPSGLARIHLPIPKEVKEQHAISEVLSDVDALIASLEKLIVKKRAIKTATMQQLLTGNKRLPGFSGEWEELVFGEVVERIVGGGTPNRANSNYWGGEIPWVTVKDFATFNPFGSQEYVTHEGFGNSSSNLIPAGKVIISTRMAIGKPVIYQVDVCINQDLKAIYPKADVSNKFLYYWFQHFEDEIGILSGGSTVKGLSLLDLRNFVFHKPKFEEQEEIASILTDIDAEISLLNDLLTKTKAIKQGMMQELLTGRIRLI